MKDTPKYPLERIVCNDLTHGKESNPIQIVNDLDDAQEPHDYVYVKQNVVTTHVPIDRNINTLQVPSILTYKFHSFFRKSISRFFFCMQYYIFILAL